MAVNSLPACTFSEVSGSLLPGTRGISPDVLSIHSN